MEFAQKAELAQKSGICTKKQNLHKKAEFSHFYMNSCSTLYWKVESAQKAESAQESGICTKSRICTRKQNLHIAQESGICINNEMTQCGRKTLNHEMFFILELYKFMFTTFFVTIECVFVFSRGIAMEVKFNLLSQ